LTLCDVENSCTKAKDIFEMLQRIYTERWKILRGNVSGFSY